MILNQHQTFLWLFIIIQSKRFLINDSNNNFESVLKNIMQMWEISLFDSY